ncbi:DgyrCDS12867 [Dimorphilus gyrociliatus]|uniref:DgyrCDS12867 n=1 Tax=Dimorphilus gyrociliatus TaxID=2664684 RepID=A0A7I8W8Z2_9ANNE|nr:DgyrCDS12867 [Dimorphilus gyrociliatus]
MMFGIIAYVVIFLLLQQVLANRPNIVLIVTDDQDAELGSMKTMHRTRQIMKEGSEFSHAYVSTPMCCPSRSSFLTGMYVHNHNVYTNNDNCTGTEWRQIHEKKTFATYLQDVANYRTSYIGKYLNKYLGNYTPPGWDNWMGLYKNSKFYNYKVRRNGSLVHYGSEESDYFTDVIKRETISFIKDSVRNSNKQPFLAVAAVPAPHGPEDAAERHRHMFANNTDHHTAAWNYAPNPDKQWILQYVGKMKPIQKSFTNTLQRKRLQTLQSVDELVKEIYDTLVQLNILDETYIIYTSDHGYHLGQFGLLKGKAMPYEFDIRVPFYIRGPGVPTNSIFEDIIVNEDIAPTLLDIGGVETPSGMDGRSILHLFAKAKAKANYIKKDGRNAVKRKNGWRHTILIERGKLTDKNRGLRDKLEAKKNLYLSKKERKKVVCKRLEYNGPCTTNRGFRCVKDQFGELTVERCPNFSEISNCLLRKCKKHKLINKRLLRIIRTNVRDFKRIVNETNSQAFKENQEKFQKKLMAMAKTCNCNRKRRKTRSIRPKRRIECDEKGMKCFEHDREHWKTEPLWKIRTRRSSRIRQHRKRKRKLPRRQHPSCTVTGVECHYMDNKHWTTAPFWNRN